MSADIGLAPPALDREVDILRRAISVLNGLLPDDWSVEVSDDVRLDAPRVDAVVVLRAPDRSQVTLVVECRRGFVTRDLPAVREQLESASAQMTARTVPAVVARYLSASARAWLDENGVSYIDATGNVRIVAKRPALVLRDRGADRDPYRGPGRPRGTLRGEPAARVVRALVDFSSPPTVPELIERSGASTGAAYRVVDFLLEEGLIERSPRGPIRTIAWRRLLERWSQDYGFQRGNTVVSAIQPRGVRALVTDLARAHSLRYAVTGSLAAERWESYAPVRLASLYVDDTMSAVEQLGLRLVDTGANVLLAAPKFDVVFDRTTDIEDVTYVSVSQAAVDLLTGPGRNPAEGQALLDWMEGHEPAWRR